MDKNLYNVGHVFAGFIIIIEEIAVSSPIVNFYLILKMKVKIGNVTNRKVG